MLTTSEKIIKGNIQLHSGTVVVSDPCCCDREIDDVRRGDWVVGIIKATIEFWGNRNAYLFAHSNTIVEPDIYDKRWEEQKGCIGVDSGMAGIFDHEYYSEEDFSFYCDACGEVDVDNPSYFLCSSGVGDGGYGYFVIKEGGEVVAIKLDFSIDPYCWSLWFCRGYRNFLVIKS